MRLLRKWFVEDISWVKNDHERMAAAVALGRAEAMGVKPSEMAAMSIEPARIAPVAKKPPRLLLGFAGTIPLGDAHRKPFARCSGFRGGPQQVPCQQRWK